MGLIYVKRPNRSFIYFHLVRQWCATGRHPGGFTRWLRPCPGWPTRFLCLAPSNAASAAAGVNPAGCHPVQLATQAGSTRRPALLISFSIFIVICTGSCTRYVHKGKKPKVQKQRSRHKVTLSLVFFFNCVFSLCILWNLASLTRGVWGTEMPAFTTSSPDSRMKN